MTFRKITASFVLFTYLVSITATSFALNSPLSKIISSGNQDAKRISEVLTGGIADTGRGWCWKSNYYKDDPRPLSDCPSNKEKVGALCFPFCPEGYRRLPGDITGICYANCPSNSTDTLLFCGFSTSCDTQFFKSGVMPSCPKKSIIGRRPYTAKCTASRWKKIVTLGTICLARRYLKCKNDRVLGSGGSLLCYDRCPSNMSINGVGDCYAGCPSGWTSHGLLCNNQPAMNCQNEPRMAAGSKPLCPKSSNGAGALGTPLQCPPHRERDGALCYTPCNPGYDRTAGFCWQECSNSFFPSSCASACAISSGTCGSVIANQVIAPVMAVVTILVTALSAGTAAPAMKAANAGMKVAANTAKVGRISTRVARAGQRISGSLLRSSSRILQKVGQKLGTYSTTIATHTSKSFAKQVAVNLAKSAVARSFAVGVRVGCQEGMKPHLAQNKDLAYVCTAASAATAIVANVGLTAASGVAGYSGKELFNGIAPTGLAGVKNTFSFTTALPVLANLASMGVDMRKYASCQDEVAKATTASAVSMHCKKYASIINELKRINQVNTKNNENDFTNLVNLSKQGWASAAANSFRLENFPAINKQNCDNLEILRQNGMCRVAGLFIKSDTPFSYIDFTKDTKSNDIILTDYTDVGFTLEEAMECNNGAANDKCQFAAVIVNSNIPNVLNPLIEVQKLVQSTNFQQTFGLPTGTVSQDVNVSPMEKLICKEINNKARLEDPNAGIQISDANCRKIIDSYEKFYQSGDLSNIDLDLDTISGNLTDKEEVEWRLKMELSNSIFETSKAIQESDRVNSILNKVIDEVERQGFNRDDASKYAGVIIDTIATAVSKKSAEAQAREIYEDPYFWLGVASAVDPTGLVAVIDAFLSDKCQTISSLPFSQVIRDPRFSLDNVNKYYAFKYGVQALNASASNGIVHPETVFDHDRWFAAVVDNDELFGYVSDLKDVRVDGSRVNVVKDGKSAIEMMIEVMPSLPEFSRLNYSWIDQSSYVGNKDVYKKIHMDNNLNFWYWKLVNNTPTLYVYVYKDQAEKKAIDYNKSGTYQVENKLVNKITGDISIAPNAAASAKQKSGANLLFNVDFDTNSNLRARENTHNLTVFDPTSANEQPKAINCLDKVDALDNRSCVLFYADRCENVFVAGDGSKVLSTVTDANCGSDTLIKRRIARAKYHQPGVKTFKQDYKNVIFIEFEAVNNNGNLSASIVGDEEINNDPGRQADAIICKDNADSSNNRQCVFISEDSCLRVSIDNFSGRETARSVDRNCGYGTTQKLVQIKQEFAEPGKRAYNDKFLNAVSIDFIVSITP